jgi:hypothetical protein
MAPQEGGGTTPVLIPCSPSAHAGPIGFSDCGWCSLNGRSGTRAGAIPEEGKRASLEGAILMLGPCGTTSLNILGERRSLDRPLRAAFAQWTQRNQDGCHSGGGEAGKFGRSGLYTVVLRDGQCGYPGPLDVLDRRGTLQ